MARYMIEMEILWAALGGFCLDLLLGDPAWMPHPVVLMGRCIEKMEGFLRKTFSNELLAGALLAAALPLGTLSLSALALWLCGLVHPVLRLGLEAVWCWQCLAVKSLGDEAERVRRALTSGTLEESRRAVGRIVGRDTQELSAEGVAKAAVETVAENFSDGVAAPLFYMLIGGAPLALTYKAVNTMDSMVGYQNHRYRYFGTAAARLDDLVNWLPARLTALLMAALAPLAGLDGWGALRIWRRDRRRHKSPNSAQTEAAMAGALRVELAGDAYYFGELHKKPALGDDLRPIEPVDIPRANRLMLLASGAAALLAAAVRFLILT